MIKSIIFVLPLFLVVLNARAQGMASSGEPSMESQLRYQALVSQQQIAAAPKAQVPLDNGVHVVQIGLGNSSQITTRTAHSAIDLVQNGTANTANIAVEADSYKAGIVQNGNRNALYEFKTAPGQQLETQVNQTGNNNNLIMHGENGLSNKIKINMTGNQTVIVRNN